VNHFPRVGKMVFVEEESGQLLTDCEQLVSDAHQLVSNAHQLKMKGAIKLLSASL